MTGTASKLNLIALIMVVVLGAYVVRAAVDWLRLPGVSIDETVQIRELLHGEGAPHAGQAGAPVTLVVFTDYQCPICRIDHAAHKNLIRTERHLRVVFKEWPILGDASRLAARAALAGAYQGRYPEMRDALMQAPMPLSAARIRQAATSAGIDWRRLERDLAQHSSAIDRELGRTSRQAFGLGLVGTPAYLVGDRLVIGRLTERDLRRLLDRNLAER